MNHDALHFTASVMGNPDYLEAVKDMEQAPDQRLIGIEKVSAVHQMHAPKDGKHD